MSVVIRLKSVGTKKKIKHRIVVTDTRFPRDGRFIEEVGSWNPAKSPAAVSIKAERVEHWISQGAKPSDTVRTILNKAGIKSANQPKK
jgi:small subunit ribosomal protein S16